MTQPTLFNTAVMTPHRTLARIVRDRALALLQSQIRERTAAITESKSPVHPATEPEKPQPLSRDGLRVRLIPDQEIADGHLLEFPMPDESRDFQYNVTRVPCPVCGFKGTFIRKRVLKGHEPLFSMKCASRNCTNSTPWLATSNMAIRHWKLTAALSQ